jgi:hypothetical protein
VVVAGDVLQPEVLIRSRAELGDPHGQVMRNVYQSARGLDPATAAPLVEAAGRIAAEQAAGGLEQTQRAGAGPRRRRIDELRRELGPPWAKDQKLAALAAWIALAQPRSSLDDG